MRNVATNDDPAPVHEDAKGAGRQTAQDDDRRRTSYFVGAGRNCGQHKRLEKCFTVELASACQDPNEIIFKLYGINAVSLLDSTDATEQDGPITPDSAPPPDAPAVQPGYRICLRQSCRFLAHSSGRHAGYCCGRCRGDLRHALGSVKGHGHQCEHVLDNSNEDATDEEAEVSITYLGGGDRMLEARFPQNGMGNSVPQQSADTRIA